MKLVIWAYLLTEKNDENIETEIPVDNKPNTNALFIEVFELDKTSTVQK